MRQIFSIILLTAAAMLTACGSGKEEDEAEAPAVNPRYVYDHLDKIIGQYGDIIMSTPPDGQAMEALMMDINSRCYMLLQQGDTLTALYFHHAIENNVRQRDSILADRIFGQCPYSAFNRHEHHD